MSEEKRTLKDKIFFGLNGFPDLMTYQAFSFLVFTYYFAVVGIDMLYMWAGYMIWGAWNAFNDPMLGALSDRKKYGKFGKRKFFMIISIVPLSLWMILLFTVPSGIEFIYFLIIILSFELVYTLFDVNTKAAFPEVWPNEKERASANLVLRVITILAILFAMVFPTLVISPMAPLPDSSPEEIARIPTMYVSTGIVFAVITLITGLLFIKFGMKEKEELKEEFENRPSFFKSLKLTLENRTFVKLILANTMNWYVLSMMTTIWPLYCIHVLGVGRGSLIIGISLMMAFIVAAITMPIHGKLGMKLGMRKAFILSEVVWIISLFPFLLLGEGMMIQGIIFAALVGFGISGNMFYFDIMMGDVIDQDQLTHGVKRSASFYGTNAFVHRLHIILLISTIALIFSGTGWGGYDPNPNVDVILGLKLLMFLFPAIALVFAIIFLKMYDLHGEKLETMRSQLIHLKP